MTLNEPLYPEVEVQLTHEDGNAFAIIGRVSAALREVVGPEVVAAFTDEATSGDYDNLLRTCVKYVTVL